MLYNKQPTTVDDQIMQLKTRGLQISDVDLARHYLSNISYYRLAGYWWPMQADKVNHSFKPNSKFEDVIALYNFDRELRLLLFDVIENRLSPDWYTIIYDKNSDGGVNMVVGFHELCNVKGFYASLMDRDEEAMRTYFERKKETETDYFVVR